MDYTLRKYRDSDKKFIYIVKKVVYRCYVEKYWGAWDDEDQVKRFEESLPKIKNNIKLIICGKKRIGFIQWSNLEDGNLEIDNICILPEYQNYGIGSAILRSLIEEHKTQKIYLQFFKDNRVGKLYERFGFEFLEELKFHIKMVRNPKN